ncbi:MAG: class I SAM-dependent methyltransferase, partial [Acidobacteriaceae bacterium]|nr:class I SAM-dependent methyltransferase [Acidobacteriaceae bacterium]
MDAGRISTSDRFERSTPASGLGGWLLRLMLQRIRSAPIRLVLGDGTAVSAPDVTPRFTVWMRDIRTLAQVMLDPDVGFGEGWTEGRIRVTGDLVDFIDTAYQHIGESQGTKWYSNILSRVMSVWQANTQKGSKRNIRSHYDLGNEFYRMWLDRQLVYTCAYYPSPSATLEAAQIAKMDHVCRKLRLQPGETVIEVGCGWGALALHMAREYGVRVKAFNISHQQIQHARERAREEQLDAQVEFIEDDYRNVSGRADAFVSIGMLEHVGRENYCELGRVIKRTLGDHGRGLLHFIGRSKRADFSRWIRKRIFPGAYAPSLDEAL